MPYPDTFNDIPNTSKKEAYYSILIHELIHWTGHPKRLNRKRHKLFGDDVYAEEELVAELGAAFLCAELHITNRTRQDAADCIANWLQLLKDNKLCIIEATCEAVKAVEFLHDLQLKR